MSVALLLLLIITFAVALLAHWRISFLEDELQAARRQHAVTRRDAELNRSYLLDLTRDLQCIRRDLERKPSRDRILLRKDQAA